MADFVNCSRTWYFFFFNLVPVCAQTGDRTPNSGGIRTMLQPTQLPSQDSMTCFNISAFRVMLEMIVSTPRGAEEPSL